MRLEGLDKRWQQAAAAILNGFKEWRPLADAALLSAAADLAALPPVLAGWLVRVPSIVTRATRRYA